MARTKLHRSRRFRFGVPFVAVKRIRIAAKAFVEVGERIPPNLFRRPRLAFFHMRGMIAPEGEPWTEAFVKSQGLEIRDMGTLGDFTFPPAVEGREVPLDGLQEQERLINEGTDAVTELGPEPTEEEKT